MSRHGTSLLTSPLPWVAFGVAFCSVFCNGCDGTGVAVGFMLPEAGSGRDATVSFDGATEGGPDAPTNPEAGADAAAGFCASNSAHTFCEDFDQGVPGLFDIKTYGGGSVAPDVSDFVSAPESLWANTPTLAGSTASAGAFVTKSFLTDGSHVRLQASYEMASACASNRDGVLLAQLTFSSSSLMLRASVGGSALLEQEVNLQDGGVTAMQSHALSRPVPTAWTVVVMDVSAASANGPWTATVEMGGAVVLEAEPLEMPIATVSSVSLTLGAGIANGVAQSGGCTVHVDNVLFDAMLRNDAMAP
jgi:hypothetical protein